MRVYNLLVAGLTPADLPVLKAAVETHDPATVEPVARQYQSQLANAEAPMDRVGLGSRVTVLDLETNETDTYVVVLAEMMDIDAGHISLASPLGRALSGKKVGEEVSLRLPTAHRRLRIMELVTVHQIEVIEEAPGANHQTARGNGKR